MPESLELLLYFLGFYLAQASAFIPENSSVFRLPRLRRGMGGGTARAGGSFRLLGALPTSRSVIATRLPFSLSGDRIRCETSLRRFQPEASPQPRSFAIASLAHTEAAGRLVRVQGEPFVRTGSNEEARLLAAWLRVLSDAPERDRPRVVREVIRRSLSVVDLETRLDSAASETRRLTYLCTAYLAAIVAMAVAAAVWQPTGRVWGSAALAMSGLHVLTFVELWMTHRSLLPDAREERLEVLLGSFLFPPTLLTMPQRLRVERLSGFNPVAVARVTQDERRFRELVRRELGRLVLRDPSDREDVVRSGGAGTPDTTTGRRDVIRQVEREELTGFLDREGLSPGALFAFTTEDAAAARYCPFCLAAFTIRGESCPECRVPTFRYGGGAAVPAWNGWTDVP